MMQWRLRHRVLALSLLPTLLVAVVLTTYWGSIKVLELEGQIQERGETLVAFLGPAAEYGVISGNHAYLDAITAKARIQPDVTGIFIQDHQGNRIYEYRAPNGSADISPWRYRMATWLFPENIQYFQQNILLSALELQDLPLPEDTSPQLQDPRLIGSVEIHLSNLPTSLQQFQWMLQSIFLILLVVIGILIVIPRWSLSLSRPLEKVAATVARIQQGDLAARSRARAGGEIGVLQRGINSMAESIERSHQLMSERINTATISLQDKLALIDTQNQALMQAQEHAELINQRKTRFLASISHELRTPLSAIKGYSELLCQHGNLDEQERHWVGIIEDASRDSLKLVNDLLDISRIEAGTVAIHHTRFDLRQTVQEVISLCRKGSGRQNVDITLLMHPATPGWINSDPLRIKQLLTNVLTNAVKFTSNSHVILRVGPHPDEAGILSLSVEDFGPGIEKEYLDQIFEPFYQIRREENALQVGSGLGLSIARGLVSLLKGELVVESEPGEGCIFHLHLPILSGTAQAIEGMDGEAPERIVLLTDDAEVRFIAQSCLGRLGLTCENVLRGAAFLKGLEGTRGTVGLIWLRQPYPELIDTLLRHQHLARRVIMTAFGTIAEPQLQQLRRQGVLLIPPYLSLDMLHGHLKRRLRAAPEPESAETTPMGQHQRQLSGLRVLVADDNATNRRLLCEFVINCGARVDEAENGEHALYRYREDHHDLILMDMHMPVMDGVTALKEIRREDPGARIIAVTADARPSVHKSLMADGFDHILTKPATQDDVIKCLTRFPRDLQERRTPASPDSEERLHEPERALRMAGGSADLANELATLLFRDLKRARGQLSDSSLKRQVLLKLAHQLKGASRYCATPRLETAASALESALRDGQETAIPRLRLALLKEVEDLLAMEAEILNPP
ncbi:ATP-binding protein [Ectothiorhodospira shaposhnikovii]|uniref:ATP-binding protein n=1 Tax=Ectothiorhodospira shaposhnikovii TaxID=1054 RepID=UPI0039A2120D